MADFVTGAITYDTQRSGDAISAYNAFQKTPAFQNMVSRAQADPTALKFALNSFKVQREAALCGNDKEKYDLLGYMIGALTKSDKSVKPTTSEIFGETPRIWNA